VNETTRLLINRIRHLGYIALPWITDITIYCKKYGLWFKSHKRDGIGKDISYKYGVYAEDYVNCFFKNKLGLKPGGIMLDIGANIGWYSVVMSKECQLKVYAFEPHPFNYSMLKENIRINNANNIHAFQNAIADQEGRMKLHVYKSYNMGRHSLVDHGKTGKYHEVDTISIDGFMKKQGMENEPVELFKIDIEGFEMAALRGARNTLRRTRYVFSEFSPAIMKTIGESPAEYVDLMQGLGFSGYIIDNENSATAVGYTTLKTYTEGVHNIFWSRGLIGQ
jgi:FkbM family methyltransferase